MKNIILKIVPILFLYQLAGANGQTQAPYDLMGSPNDCQLTVHDYGYENVPSQPQPKRPHKKPTVPFRYFYADVSVSSLPGVIFHMKLNRKRFYVGYDGNTGHQLRIRGSLPNSKTPLSRGHYQLLNQQALVERCLKLVPSN